MNEKVFSTDWLGRQLTVKTGKLARQATAAVTVQYGETVILATVMQSKVDREGIDFFPLQVDFEEKLYAAGIIKGSRWIKREGRPSDDSILTGRMIDRAIRPLFESSSRKDVQVLITVLSVDQENDHDVISLVAASVALAISGVNWQGPIGGIRVGRVEGKFIFNPTYAEREKSDLDLIVSSTAEKVIMIEAAGQEIKESEMFEAIMAGHQEQQVAIKFIEKIKKELATPPAFFKEGKGLVQDAEKAKKITLAENWLNKNCAGILFDKIYYTKGERKAAVGAIKEKLEEYLTAEGLEKSEIKSLVASLVEKTVEKEVTNGILKEKRRVDGRKLDEIRTLWSEVSVLPRTHGSSIFNRGETQVMSIVTLGASGAEQSLEGVEGKGVKRYMHHYNFPPFSVGEAKPLRAPGRREIGHGALAEKAIMPLLPTKEEFPYTVRVVSETLGSNGSSSMGSTCASTLALMDAGIPLKKPVAGIAMGLASNHDMSAWEVLTDLQDLEDGEGGMDFKIAGTADGITAIQLDTKTNGLTEKIIEKTLKEGLIARLKILEVMKETIAEPRKELSPYAPRIESFYIDPERIRDIIGPGGKVIRRMTDEYEVAIDVEDDGLVMVCGTNAAKLKQAVDLIKMMTRELEPGEIFTGAVLRIMDFGAIVELTPYHDGMVHVSEMAPYRVENVSDILEEGDMVTVKIKEIDKEKGRVSLTMAGLEENEKYWARGRANAANSGGPKGNDFGRNDRGPRRDFRR
jgi:polyribonucleotide nucleotidyltransferase